MAVKAEVVDGEPTRHRALEWDRLDRLAVAGSPKRRPGRPGAVAAVAQHLQSRLRGGQQLEAGWTGGEVSSGQRALGHQPGLGLGGDVALVAVAAVRAGLAGMPGLRVDD